MFGTCGQKESPVGVDVSYSCLSDGSYPEIALFTDTGIQVSEEDDLVGSRDGRENVVELAVECFLDFIFSVEGGSVSTDNGCVLAVYQLDSESDEARVR